MKPYLTGEVGGVKIEKTDFEKWKKIAEKVKNVRRELHELSQELDSVPKSVYSEKYHQISKHLRQIKSDLEDRMFKEHPKQADENIFYGDSKEE